MNHLQIFLVAFFVFLYKPFIVLSAVTCIEEWSEDLKQDYCTFRGLLTNQINPYFNPYHENSTNVELVQITDSFMPILTNEICTAFPNLSALSIIQSSLSQILEGALNNCANLEQLISYKNELTELPVYLFINNPKMRFIEFAENKLSKINMTMFQHTKELEYLHLHNNFLTHLNFHQMPPLNKLKTFSVDGNNLTDLDEHSLIQKMPNLKKINFLGNSLSCDIKDTILKTFKEAKIETSSFYTKKAIIVGYIDCLQRAKYLKAINCYQNKFHKDRNLLAIELEMVDNDLQKNILLQNQISGFVLTVMAMLSSCCFIIFLLGMSYKKVSNAMIEYLDKIYFYYSADDFE